MKYNFIIITIILLSISLLSSLIIIYSIINNQIINFENQLIEIQNNDNSNKEIQKKVNLFRVLNRKKSIEITRALTLLLSINLIIILLLLSLYIYSIQKPINYFYKKIKEIKINNIDSYKQIEPKGSIEIRSLVLAFNILIEKIINYQKLIGDINKFQGWKQISRIIVHEINNLISPIQTYTEYLLEKQSDNDKLNFILLKLNDIRNVLQKFREISHLPDANLFIANIIPLIKEVIYEFKSVELLSNIEEIYLFIDPVLFKEILRNLIKNGLESGEKTNVKIKIVEENENIFIQIIDNGSGIKEENLDKIFEPGFTTKKGSIGIGLSIVKTLVEELNGKIKVESKINEGTNFIVEFKK